MALRIALIADVGWPRQEVWQLLQESGPSDIDVGVDDTEPRRLPSLLAHWRPELIVLDTALLDRGGLQAVEWVMSECPTPIVLLSRTPWELASERPEPPEPLVEQAQRLGVLAVERLSARPDVEERARLRAQLHRLARVPVVRHLHPPPLPALPLDSSGRWQNAHGPASPSARPLPALLRAPGPIQLVGVGASMGGPDVLVEVLRQLGADFPAGIAVVQHLPGNFAASFADYLRSRTQLAVQVVAAARPIQPATVYLSSEDRHLIAMAGGMLGVSDEAPIFGHRPSVDRLFRSLAEQYGRSAVGVILSGLGRDGSAGLLEMRRRGAITLAQDADSAAVDGMTGAARELGAVMYSLDPQGLAQALRRLCQREER